MARKISFTTAYRIRIKRELIAYKGGECSQCGYDKDVPSAYDFHHRDPKEKDFSISHYAVLNRKKLFKEVDKCDLVCKNCHAEIHDDKELREEAERIHKEWLDRKLQPQICPYCGKQFQPYRRNQKACKKCAPLSNKKVPNPPTKEKLTKMMKTMTWREIGKKYDVSDTAVKKWAKRMGIEWRPHARRNKR